MKSSPLLDKVRYMKRAIQRSEEQLNYEEGARILREGIEADVFIISPSGRILGYSLIKGSECDYFKENILDKEEFPEWYNEKFLMAANESRTDIVQESENCIFVKDERINCVNPPQSLGVVPILGGGRRLGTVLLHSYTGEFSVDDIVLAEIGAAIVSMEMMRAREERKMEETRYRAITEVAFSSLSYSELEAMAEIFRELNGEEGIVVASKIADNLGITRSVIVNALRKFESAGVIDSRSLGMKGTFIKVKHPIFKEEIFSRI